MKQDLSLRLDKTSVYQDFCHKICVSVDSARPREMFQNFAQVSPRDKVRNYLEIRIRKASKLDCQT